MYLSTAFHVSLVLLVLSCLLGPEFAHAKLQVLQNEEYCLDSNQRCGNAAPVTPSPKRTSTTTSGLSLQSLTSLKKKVSRPVADVAGAETAPKPDGVWVSAPEHMRSDAGKRWTERHETLANRLHVNVPKPDEKTETDEGRNGAQQHYIFHYLNAKQGVMDKIMKLMDSTQHNRNSLLQNMVTTGINQLDLEEQGFVPQDGQNSDASRAHKSWAEATREYLDELTNLMDELVAPVAPPQKD